MKARLLDNDTEMYSSHNEGKSVVAERFSKNLKNAYIEKLDDIVDEYNNKYYRTIKMRLVI